MSENSSHHRLRLDPWAASSLLQKSIRRGDAELARQAAKQLHQSRGTAIWRRLLIIAVEDIGIADIGLVADLSCVGTDKTLRSVLGADADLVDQFCLRMAEATKDRSADYLYCAATKLEACKVERTDLEKCSTPALLEIAIDTALPLFRRANAALLACTSESAAGTKLRRGVVEQLLSAAPIRHVTLDDGMLRLAAINLHPLCLMLPLLWPRFWHDCSASSVVDDEVPAPAFLGGVPLYTFDMHTAVGKQAIRRFAHENEQVRSMLDKWAPCVRRVDVSAMAAFYADAAPVKRRLNWPTGSLLLNAGFIADMVDAGCSIDGAIPLLHCTQENLDHLNDLRRAVLRSSTPKK